MSAEVNIEPGVCLAFGGTNARIATCDDGDILRFRSIMTPTEPNLFFKWIACNLLDASNQGNEWLVAGFPGVVSPDGRMVGPLNNVSGMKEQAYDLQQELVAADPEVERVLTQGFVLLAVNDGTLAAQAAASRIGEHAYNKTGALILGTGIGAGVVERDPAYTNVHRIDNSNPYEVGHAVMSADPYDRFEDKFSGPGLERRYGTKPDELEAEHPAWLEEGAAVGRLATLLGLMNGVELVVPTGGVGAGASDKYKPHLIAFMEAYRAYGNGTQKKFAPEIMLVPPNECNEFEMYGAQGVMRDFLSS